MRRHYYAKISTVDEKIGEILDALEEKGYLENALVIFTSDHGDMVGDHQMAYKWLMYDPIVNVPLTIWDTRTGAQGVCEDLVSHIDVGPTVLEAAGIEIPGYFEGTSLMSYVDGEGREPDAAVFCEDNYEIMVRTDRYKLFHYTFQEDDGELYDLDQDPDELYNRFHNPDYGEVKAEMLAILRDWLAQSTYRTAGYKNTQYAGPRLWPQQSPYLLGGYRNNPKL
jgi:arylsulfatase A-like enzyme